MTHYSVVMDFPSVTADNMNFFIIISTKLRLTEISFQPTNLSSK